MLQFYFLSVLLNVIAGIMLVFVKESSESGSIQDRSELNSSFKTSSLHVDLLENNNFKLVLGILTAFTAIMKLLSVVPNDIPIAGDLIPVIAGALGGTSMLLSYYTSVTKTEIKLSPLAERIFIAGRRYVGIFCILAALLHFLFPKVLFL